MLVPNDWFRQAWIVAAAAPKSECPMPNKDARFQIRAALPKDEQRWRALFAELVATGPEPCAADAPGHVWECISAEDHPMRLLIAANDRDEAIGFLLYLTHPYSWSRRPLAYLLDLYVDPAMRGVGAGTALIERLATIGREAGWLKIYWMTQDSNDKAHALYSKLASRSPLVRYDLMLNPH
jgi:ribosomal protein S18 acetylase RimI-like enzyme